MELPVYTLRTKKKGTKMLVWGAVRKKFVQLTPEEHVRQCFIRFLHEVKDVPFSLMSVERQILVNGQAKRFDLVVYDREGNPFLCVECKSPRVEIDEQVLFQVANYNKAISAPYWVLTNGKRTFCFEKTNKGTFQQASFPEKPDFS